MSKIILLFNIIIIFSGCLAVVNSTFNDLEKPLKIKNKFTFLALKNKNSSNAKKDTVKFRD